MTLKVKQQAAKRGIHVPNPIAGYVAKSSSPKPCRSKRVLSIRVLHTDTHNTKYTLDETPRFIPDKKECSPPGSLPSNDLHTSLSPLVVVP
jgi:hypothetical protein